MPNPPASTSWILKLQTCTTTPDLIPVCYEPPCGYSPTVWESLSFSASCQHLSFFIFFMSLYDQGEVIAHGFNSHSLCDQQQEHLHRFVPHFCIFWGMSTQVLCPIPSPLFLLHLSVSGAKVEPKASCILSMHFSVMLDSPAFIYPFLKSNFFVLIDIFGFHKWGGMFTFLFLAYFI